MCAQILGFSRIRVIPGNEVADALAKQAAMSTFVGPEPAIGINTATVSTEIRRWANKEHQ